MLTNDADTDDDGSNEFNSDADVNDTGANGNADDDEDVTAIRANDPCTLVSTVIGDITFYCSVIKFTDAIDVTPRIQSLLRIREITAAAALVVAANSNLVVISFIQILLFRSRYYAIADGFSFPFSGLTVEILDKNYFLPFTITLNGGGGSKGRPIIVNNRLCLFSIVTVHGINRKIVLYLFLNSFLDDLNLGTP